MALESLMDIIPSMACKVELRNVTRPHVMVNFAIGSGTPTASTTIHGEILNSVAVVGGFCMAWVDGRMNMRSGHFISGKFVNRRVPSILPH